MRVRGKKIIINVLSRMLSRWRPYYNSLEPPSELIASLMRWWNGRRWEQNCGDHPLLPSFTKKGARLSKRITFMPLLTFIWYINIILGYKLAWNFYRWCMLSFNKEFRIDFIACYKIEIRSAVVFKDFSAFFLFSLRRRFCGNDTGSIVSLKLHWCWHGLLQYHHPY